MYYLKYLKSESFIPENEFLITQLCQHVIYNGEDTEDEHK